MTSLRKLEQLRDIAWYNWLEADDAWSAEITREYPLDAGTRRYTADGTQTPRLRRLYEAWGLAGEAYRSAQQDYIAAKGEAFERLPHPSQD